MKETTLVNTCILFQTIEIDVWVDKYQNSVRAITLYDDNFDVLIER